MTVPATKKPPVKRYLTEDDLGVCYYARRTLRLNGVSYKAGDKIAIKDVEASARPEALVRSGLIREG